MKTYQIATAILLAFTLAACDNKAPTPETLEVNAENCMIEKIKLISDRTAREEFAGKCSRRSVTSPTKEPANWLQLETESGQ